MRPKLNAGLARDGTDSSRVDAARSVGSASTASGRSNRWATREIFRWLFWLVLTLAVLFQVAPPMDPGLVDELGSTNATGAEAVPSSSISSPRSVERDSE